jgi:excisionase family DNA binding protein
VDLSIDEAAKRLGKSTRQVRYMIANGTLRAHKIKGRWRIDDADLPRSDARQQTETRKQRQLRAAVERGLELDTAPRSARYSVGDLKAHQIASPLHQRAVAELGDDHPATRALRRVLEQLALGCHRFHGDDKAEAYSSARDAASLAVCELLIVGTDAGQSISQAIEQELMAALAGLLRRLDSKRLPS